MNRYQKKRIVLALALSAAVLFAAGCERGDVQPGGGEPESSGGESASAPAETLPSSSEADSSSEPEEEGEKVRYPGEVPEEIAESASYREALEMADVILVRGVPVTGGERPKAFLDAIEAGETASLLVYSYGWDGQYQTAAFSGAKGAVVCTSTWFMQYDSVRGGQVTKENCGILELSEYGYLSWAPGAGYELSALQVVNDSEIFADDAQRKEIYNTYLKPFIQCGALAQEWTNADELPSVTFLYLFEDINGPQVWQEYGSEFPFEKVKETALRYFEVSDDTLRDNKFYKQELDAFEYEGGRGGGPVCIRAVSAAERGGMTEIDYEWYSPTTGAPTADMRFRLTAEKTGDGFRLVSNAKITA